MTSLQTLSNMHVDMGRDVSEDGTVTRTSVTQSVRHPYRHLLASRVGPRDMLLPRLLRSKSKSAGDLAC